MKNSQNKARRGFTLIELMVVIGVVLVLATLALIISPRLAEDQRVTRSADQLSTWLLIAKQRAYRDQAPRGVRLIPHPDNPNQVKELVYIERPEPFRGGSLQVPAPVPPPVPGGLATPAAAVPGFRAASTGFIHGKDLTNGNGAVTLGNAAVYQNPIAEPGDFLVFDSLEIIPYNSHRIAALYYVAPTGVAPYGGTYLVFAPAYVIGGDLARLINSGVPIPFPGNTEFHIVRRPRPLAGEPALQLPKDMVIDVDSALDGTSIFPGRTTALPPVGTEPWLDIVFNQRGQLMDANAIGGKIILRLRNSARAADDGDQMLVTVYGRTGMVAVHPLAGPGERYKFVLDGKSSGL